MRVASLVSMLSNNPIIGRKVVDRTNLTGTYAFNVLYPHDPDPSNGGAAFEFGFSDERWPLDAGGQAVIAEGIRVLLDRGPLKAHHDAGPPGRKCSTPI